MISPRNLVWPHISRESRLDAIKNSHEEWQDRDLIQKANWANDTDVALEQARQLADQETERKRSAETKASIYLAVIAAIVPVLSSLLTDFFGKDFDNFPTAFQVISIILFVSGMIYLVTSGIWAFRTLAVSAHTRVDAVDIAKLWTESEPKAGLTKELLISTRLNHAGVNKKMDYIRMAHEFLLRTFLTFTALFLIIVLREPIQSGLQYARPWISKVWMAMTT